MNFVENIPCIPRYHVTDTGEVYRKNEYTSKTGLIYNKPNKPLVKKFIIRQTGIAKHSLIMQNINQTLEKYMKLNIGDPVLVIGPAHFEKAEVIERSKGIYTLNNQMKITKDLSIIGNSRFKITPFNNEEYNYLLAVNQIPRQLSIIKEKMDNGLAKESILKIHQKLKNIITKYT